jgi:hypothetical protein
MVKNQYLEMNLIYQQKEVEFNHQQIKKKLKVKQEVKQEVDLMSQLRR